MKYMLVNSSYYNYNDDIASGASTHQLTFTPNRFRRNQLPIRTKKSRIV